MLFLTAVELTAVESDSIVCISQNTLTDTDRANKN